VTVGEDDGSRLETAGEWSARYQLGLGSEWRECRIVDLSFEGAAVELHDVAPLEPLVGPLSVEISSIASDQVGVELRTVIRHADLLEADRAIVDVEFAHWRREESLLLHLLVGLRNYV
jgi:hypothetical protein